MNLERDIILPAWEPVSDEPGYQWVAKHVELPPDSELKNFDFELFPLARFVLDHLCHNEYLRRFTEMLSAQVGKTVTILAYVCWKIVNRPASVGWYTDTNLNAKGDYKTKILPILESCAKVAPMLPSDRVKKNNTLIQFGFMNLRVMGAESRANREGKTMSEVLCDEVRNYPPGAMQQIDNRFKTVSNYRRILFSSAGDITEEPWPSFLAGTRHLGFWSCLKCGHRQTFRFGRDISPLYPESRKYGGFVWDDTPVTHPGENVWDMAALMPTVRYECENESCRHRFFESEKLLLIRSVEFVATNPMANPRENISVHCWEAYMPFAGCSWSNIVSKFLHALVAMRQGNIEPMKVFVKETLGEPWEERGEKPAEGEILKRCGDYKLGEEWPEALDITKLITVDVQQAHLVVVLRQWRRGGSSRLIHALKLLSFDELETFQRDHAVLDRCVWVDCAHTPKDVYHACMAHGRWKQGRPEHIWDGWTPMLGDDAQEFTRSVDGHSFKSFWKRVLIDPLVGTTQQGHKLLPRYSWSKPHYFEALNLYVIPGKTLDWQIPSNIPSDYVKQLQTVERRTITDAEGRVTGHDWHERGRHDYHDCELMQLVVADVGEITKL